MDRHEYKRQNEQRDSNRKAKELEELQAEEVRKRGVLRWRPVWWKIPSDRFGFFVAAFTGALAIFSVWQLIVIHGRLEAMETDKRPWLKVDVSVNKPIIFSEWGYAKGINVPLTINLKNYGQVPAVNVRVWPMMLPDHPNDPDSKLLDGFQKMTCEDARASADKNPIGGLAIFPGEPSSDFRYVGIGNAYQADDRILFAVFGCIDYSYGEGRHGQTGFRMRLGQVINKLELGLPFIHGAIQPSDGPISPELLAKGFPTTPAKIGHIQPDDVFFRMEEGGNYAK
jgi:hypothetical protein